MLEGAENVRVQDVCSGATLGHGDLVSDPLALGLVLRALEDPAARPPLRCDLRAEGASS